MTTVKVCPLSLRRMASGLLVALAAGIWLAMPPGAAAQVLSPESTAMPLAEASTFAGMKLAPVFAGNKPTGHFIQSANSLNFANLKRVIRDGRSAQNSPAVVASNAVTPAAQLRPLIAERPVGLSNQGPAGGDQSPSGIRLSQGTPNTSPENRNPETRNADEPIAMSAVVVEREAKPSVIQLMPRYTGGAKPIQAMTTDNQGHPVLIQPKSEPIPEFGIGGSTPDGGYNALLQAEPDSRNSVNQYMSDALGAYRAKAYPLALKQVQKALLLDAHNPDLLAALAEIQLKLGQASLAQENYHQAQILSPEKYGIRYAQLLSLNGSPEAAIQVLKALHRENPKQPQVAYLLGTLYEDQGQTTLALQYLHQAAQLHPASADIQYNLGLAYELSGDRLRAEKHYRQALNLHPAAPDVSKALARVRHSGGV